MDHATPTLRRRRDGWTPDRQAGFVAALTGGASVGAAAAAVGMSRRAAYRLRDHPAGAAVAAAWRKPSLLTDDEADAAIARGMARGEAALAAAEAAYPGGDGVWLLRQLRAADRRARRREAAGLRREKAGRGEQMCDLRAAGRGADGRFAVQKPVVS